MTVDRGRVPLDSEGFLPLRIGLSMRLFPPATEAIPSWLFTPLSEAFLFVVPRAELAGSLLLRPFHHSPDRGLAEVLDLEVSLTSKQFHTWDSEDSARGTCPSEVSSPSLTDPKKNQ